MDTPTEIKINTKNTSENTKNR